MENNEPQPLPHDGSPAAVAVEILQRSITEAFTGMGSAMLAICQDQKIMAGKINELAIDRNAQLEVIKSFVEKLKELVERQESDRAVLQVLMEKAAGPQIH